MKKYRKILEKKRPALNSDQTNKEIQADIEKNIEILKELFKDCSDVVFRPFNAGKLKAYILFVDGFIDTAAIEVSGIKQILNEVKDKEMSAETLMEQIVSLSAVEETSKLDEVVTNVLKGNTLLLVDKATKALIFDEKGGQRRGVGEPETESAVRGPREGFTEILRVNTALIRHRIRSNRLKIISRDVGEETNTGLAILYVEGLAAPDLVKECLDRIDRIKIDGVLDSGYIEEFIEDSPWSLFPQIQNTERPDTVAAPATFWQFLQASSDYYNRFHISIFLRLLRVILMFFALELPSIYIAITTYHQEMIPTTLLFSIAASREAIPFPGFVEALIMEISFEALREAGVRLPQIVGQAVSILGALVIGQAAVEAGIVSAPMVIVVSITGIASFTMPRYNMAISIRLLRFPLMVLAGMFGLFGIVLGTLVVLTHLCKMRSFGIPYFWPLAPMNPESLKDIFIRVPWWAMDQRPDQTVKEDTTRQTDHLKPSPKLGEEGSPS
jgi:spore germination protein KA